MNLTTVTLREAERLDSRLVRASFELFDVPDVRGRHEVYPADCPDDETERTVWFEAGRRVRLTGSAVGVLQVIRHKAAVGEQGTEFPGFVEVRFIVDR